jgi:hypothetical protein
VMTHTRHPSCAGGIGRRSAAQGQFRQKVQDPTWKS